MPILSCSISGITSERQDQHDLHASGKLNLQPEVGCLLGCSRVYRTHALSLPFAYVVPPKTTPNLLVYSYLPDRLNGVWTYPYVSSFGTFDLLCQLFNTQPTFRWTWEDMKSAGAF